MKKIGILLTNTGTPDEPTSKAVRRYLREFLSDKRIVQLPRIIWLPILYLLVLPFRAKKSAKLYQEIWRDNDSPMRIFMQHLEAKLQKQLPLEQIVIGMNYGNPSIANALEKFRQEKINDIIVLPLFPQFSHTSTSSSLDRVHAALKKWPVKPTLRIIDHYHNHRAYILALANSIRKIWSESKPLDHLLISFHGIPERFVEKGDPYASQCEQTATLLAAELQLKPDKWTLCYQSQFGYDKWLKPSTQKLLSELPQQGIKNIDIICPGFSVDCLETLEEIQMRGQETFTHVGGGTLRYIPALNDSRAHIEMLIDILEQTKGTGIA